MSVAPAAFDSYIFSIDFTFSIRGRDVLLANLLLSLFIYVIFVSFTITALTVYLVFSALKIDSGKLMVLLRIMYFMNN